MLLLHRDNGCHSETKYLFVLEFLFLLSFITLDYTAGLFFFKSYKIHHFLILATLHWLEAPLCGPLVTIYSTCTYFKVIWMNFNFSTHQDIKTAYKESPQKFSDKEIAEFPQNKVPPQRKYRGIFFLYHHI